MNAENASTPPPLESPKPQGHMVRNIAILAVLLILGFLVVAGAGTAFVLAKGFASTQNDEIFTTTRFDADYSSWKKGLERLKAQQALGSSAPAASLDASIFQRWFQMPPKKSVEAALKRRLPYGVRLVSMTPAAFTRAFDASSVTYNLELAVDSPLSLVGSQPYAAPAKASPVYKKLAGYLVFDDNLPSGTVYRAAEAKEALPAGQKIMLPWTVRKASKDGLTWKILDAEPLPFERNSSFESRYLRENKTGAVLLRGSEQLAGFPERVERMAQELTDRLAALEQDAAAYRQQVMAGAPPKPVFNPKAGDGGVATNAAVGMAGGAAVGAGIGAIADGGDGAAIGAGAGAGAGLIGGLIKGSVEKDQRKKAYQAQYNAQLASWRSAVGKLEADATAYRNNLLAELEKEMKDKAAAHDETLKGSFQPSGS